MILNKDAKLSLRFSLLSLRTAVIALFLGRAWQHLYWDGPYRSLLWDESWMSPLVSALGGDWSHWVTSAATDQAITVGVRCIGLLFILAAFAAFRVKGNSKWERSVLQLAAAWLMILAFIQMKEKFYHLGQFFEYALQWGSPFLLLAVVKKNVVGHGLEWAFRILIALTFICHGLYAVGYYPRPENFLTMTMAGLGLNNAQAEGLLHWAGVLDFLAALLLLIPNRKIAIYGLVYMLFWGFLTTMARVWSYSFLVSWSTVLLQWLHESILRFPHFLVPLSLIGVWKPRMVRYFFGSGWSKN